MFKTDSKSIFNVTKYFCFICRSFKLSIHQKIMEKKKNGFHLNIKQHNCFQHR